MGWALPLCARFWFSLRLSEVILLAETLENGKNPAPASVTAAEAEESRHAYGQRRINMIWEITQALIALSVIWGTFSATIWVVVEDSSNRLMAFLFMTNVVSIVIGFYFGRTNHQRVGGTDTR